MPRPLIPHSLITVAEAAEMHNISISALQKACASGELKAEKRARALFINRRSLDKYVATKTDRLSRRGRKRKT
jgi:hypothetical protein